MKIISRVKATILNIRKSIERFPVTIGMSIILTILLIYFNEVSSSLSEESRESLVRLNMVVGLGIPLSLCIGLLYERFNKGKSFIWYILGAFLLFLYHNVLLDDFQMVSISRYIGTMVFLILVFFYALNLWYDVNYEAYVIKIFSGWFITVLYASVLYFGISAILFTIESLFDININRDLYLYSFFIVTFIFGISMFLSKIPLKDQDFKDYLYPKSLKVLLVYIVIPLISIYTIILYAYFVKILISWEWPKGLVSHLVLWYSAISAGVIFLITPVLYENKVANIFKIWFPKFILPILVMMFISIWQRIDQYGITENRYYIVLLSIWVFGIMLYFSFMKPLKNIVIPISLSIFVLISIYGPISSYSISKASQNNRLNKILRNNDMLVEGIIKSNSNADKQSQTEISNIISYFNSNHSLGDIKVLPKDFQLADTINLFGFEYKPYEPSFGSQDYYSYYTDINQKPISIEGFDYYVNMSTWNQQEIITENINIRYNQNNYNLSIYEDGDELLIINLEEASREIDHSLNTEKNSLDISQMTIDREDTKIKVRLIFTNINGRYNINSDEITLDNADFLLFIDKK